MLLALSDVLLCCTQAGKYRVIEINTSINRTGAQVLRLVGEATQSQRVSLTSGAAAAPADADAALPPALSKAASKFFGAASRLLHAK